jgi:hypothetical protein
MSDQALVEHLQFSSTLPESYRSDVEQLLFFNPGQLRATVDIQQSIARHGLPEIAVEQSSLHVIVGELGRVQTLFATAAAERDGAPGELAGAVVYFRAGVDRLVILHVAVSERFSSAGDRADQMVVPRLLQAVREAAKRLRGVRSVTLYVRGVPTELPIRHARPPANADASAH